MVVATELREGMVVRIEGEVYKVLEVEAKAGAAKMGGVVKTKLVNVHSGRFWEPHFRPQEKLEDLELERHLMEFLYSEGGTGNFMRPDTYEQVEVSGAILGPGEKFLQPGMELPVEFFVVSLSVSFFRMWWRHAWPPRRRPPIRNKTARGRKPR